MECYRKQIASVRSRKIGNTKQVLKEKGWGWVVFVIYLVFLVLFGVFLSFLFIYLFIFSSIFVFFLFLSILCKPR